MPRRCTICNSPEREAIDRALVGGQNLTEISALFRVSHDALLRHRDRHLPQHLAQAQAAQDVARADDLLAQVRALLARTLAILDRAEGAGDLRTAILAIREARGHYELLARLLGGLDERGLVQVALVTSPEWVETRTRLLEALTPYPEARRAVAQALLEAGK